MTEKAKKEDKQKKGNLVLTVSAVALVAVLLGGAAYKVVSMKTSDSLSSTQKIAQMESQINRLESMLELYATEKGRVDARDVVALNEKVDAMEKVNTEVLDSKASLNALLGVIERVDALELQLKKLGSVSSRGALVLTAAGLVEGAAKKREPFMYEASVLEELSKGTPMEKSAQIISDISVKGLPSREDLIEKFLRLYELSFMSQEPQVQNEKVLETPQAPKSWTENLKEKLSTLIVIEKNGEAGELDLTVEKDPTDEVYRLVRNGEFETAILKMNVDQKYQTEQFSIWIEEVRSEKVFDREMEKIKALTLGNMKTETLRQAF